MLATVPIAARLGDPETARFLTGPPALACETFPQAQRAVATGRYAAILPTFARRELSPRVCHELAVPLPSRKVSLAWHRRLERQQPRVVALIDPLATAFAGRALAQITGQRAQVRASHASSYVVALRMHPHVMVSEVR